MKLDDLPDDVRLLLLRRSLDIQQKMTALLKMQAKSVPIAGTMHKYIPEGVRSTAKISYQEAKADDLLFDNMRCMVDGRADRYCPPGKYTRLLCKRTPEDPKSEWCIMMTDAPYEIRSSMEFIKKARGHVLVTGLGLGATLLPVMRKRSVSTITVIEKNADVVDLVLPHLWALPGGKKIMVAHADALTWEKHKTEKKFDTIWLDIWPDVDTKNLLEMQLMRKKYKRWLAKNGWIGIWEWDYLHRAEAEYQKWNRLMNAAAGGDPLRKLEGGGL